MDGKIWVIDVFVGMFWVGIWFDWIQKDFAPHNKIWPSPCVRFFRPIPWPHLDYVDPLILTHI